MSTRARQSRWLGLEDDGAASKQERRRKEQNVNCDFSKMQTVIVIVDEHHQNESVTL